jgi:hypothetical protein
VLEFPYFCCLLCSVVVLNDLWVALGNSEEVAAALTQALRNSLERYPCILFLMLQFRISTCASLGLLTKDS